MMTIVAVAGWLLPLLYLALLIDYGGTFFLRTKAHVRNPWLVAVIAFHLAFLVVRGIVLGRVPMVTTEEILSLLALSTAAVYCVAELAGGDRRTGMFVLLLVFLFQYTSSTFLWRADASLGAAAQSSWARLHIVPAVLAYTAMAFAAVYGLLHLVAQRDLKRHHFGLLFDRLPPLELLGKMTWYALVVGFVLMTVCIATGAVVFGHLSDAQSSGAMDTKVASKIVIGSIAWLICLVAVLGRWLGKWSDRRLSGIAVAGFLVIMVLLIFSAILSV